MALSETKKCVEKVAAEFYGQKNYCGKLAGHRRVFSGGERKLLCNWGGGV